MPGEGLLACLLIVLVATGYRVRQFSQGTDDGGKTWSTEYDLIYVPQGAAFSAL